MKDGLLSIILVDILL